MKPVLSEWMWGKRVIEAIKSLKGRKNCFTRRVKAKKNGYLEV